MDDFDRAVNAIRSWAAGMYSADAKERLLAVASDLETNKAVILGPPPKAIEEEE